MQGVLKPPYHLGFHGSPLQILWRKKKEGENFEEEEEGMRGGRRKKERRAPLALDPGSAAGERGGRGDSTLVTPGMGNEGWLRRPRQP